jgi:hypothetical protein
VAAEYSGKKHVDENMTVQLKQGTGNSVYELEMVFDTVIREKDVATDPSSKGHLQLAFKGNVLTGRLPSRYADAFLIKFLLKGGINLTELRLIEIH